ncbi:MAG: MATE family efflux transporter [Blautia marasmi]
MEALAALGTSDWLSFTAMGGITGVAQGFSVLISQCFGAKDEKRLKKAVAMSVWTGSLLTLLVMALFICNLSRLLGLLRVPSNIREPAYNYLQILMFGLVATALYNICSGILRAMGDSRTPLRAMIGASAVNIILDLIFVLVFHWGVEGAAMGTVLAQVCSGTICFLQLKNTVFGT